MRHLNNVFCIKSHWAERLPEIAERNEFDDLNIAIQETIDYVAAQITRLENIYYLLKSEPSIEDCASLIDYIESSFTPVHKESAEPALRDLKIVFYMQVMECLAAASFRVLQEIAPVIDNADITRLLQECINAARPDKSLVRAVGK